MIMNDLILRLQEMPWLVAVIAAVSGYLIGSLSPARIIYYFVRRSTDYSPFAEPIPHSDELFESNLISATWVTKKLGKQYGCITSLLDMIKVGLPTLLFKLLFTAHPFFLLVALTGITGHNFPVYHRFRGGRGESPILGSLLVINWFGLFIANGLAAIMGFISGSILVLRWGGYVILIFWFWYWFQDPAYVAFMILANALYWFSMRNDLRQFINLKKNRGLSFSEEDVSDFILMGKGPGRFLDQYGLYHVIKRFLKR